MANFFQAMEQETVRRLRNQGLNFGAYQFGRQTEVDDDDDEDEDDEDDWDEDETSLPRRSVMPAFRGFPEIYKFL